MLDLYSHLTCKHTLPMSCISSLMQKMAVHRSVWVCHCQDAGTVLWGRTEAESVIFWVDILIFDRFDKSSFDVFMTCYINGMIVQFPPATLSHCTRLLSYLQQSIRKISENYAQDNLCGISLRKKTFLYIFLLYVPLVYSSLGNTGFFLYMNMLFDTVSLCRKRCNLCFVNTLFLYDCVFQHWEL